VVGGKKEKKKVTIKRLPLHRLATRDVFEAGMAKMIAIDLPKRGIEILLATSSH
jgi:hypothetical protein